MVDIYTPGMQKRYFLNNSKNSLNHKLYLMKRSLLNRNQK